ncbi:conserved hypothetical protein [Uncinocarpus reesii 1704]|uniref:E3 ubiquitin-protein ligase RNF216 RING finger HC subclass domain-containing protein n=1 Tax=Uncinocarpus reesii (strain UAMH 1704) TaxID=336963 RepID=C4JHA5_UNCRE|nr:uncharacterized protein UREG_02678 [Uncinocarpus reesii 1704]EEP77829.1 conserved hypothetical protein [Uncinocarpus reesii 1704]
MVFIPPFLRTSKPSHSRSKVLSSPSNASTASLAPASSTPITPASSSSTPSPASPSASSATASASTTLIEALRGNPFGTSKSKCPATIRSHEEDERERLELNNFLLILAELFPDVKVEVFRELLLRFDGNSRLQVCVEQLLRYRNEWVKGRWNVPAAADAGSTPASRQVAATGDEETPWAKSVPEEEKFRSDYYKKAVKAVLCHEFRSISRSAVDAVLAEVNYSYTRARPTLKHLSRKTWRATLGNILSFKKTKEKEYPPLLVWQRQPNGDVLPHLKGTGCAELDNELYDTLLAPLIAQRKEKQEDEDHKLAHELNEAEAKAADALYECSCCLSDVAFEQISMCSESSHIICFSCIQRTIREALFGQGWGNSIHNEKSTLRCLAPLPDGICGGVLDGLLVKQAILADKAGSETYQKFETRLAEEALFKSQLKLIRCPSCSYAEYDPIYHPSSRVHQYETFVYEAETNGLLAQTPHVDVAAAVLAPDVDCLSSNPQVATNSHALGPPLTRPGLEILPGGRPLRGQENLALMDGAVDGPADLDGDSDEDVPEDEEGEGYKHFCEHFRINPGSRCTECNKCDLYMAEDEEAVAQRAGEKAEREWRHRQGISTNLSPHRAGYLNVQSYDHRNGNSRVHSRGISAPWDWDWKFDSEDWKGRYRFWAQDVWRDGRWKREAQYLVDRMVEILIVVET